MDETIMSAPWFIALGYVIFFLYFAVVSLGGIIVEKKTKIDKLICRKSAHIIASFAWIVCYLFFRCSLHWVIVNGIGAVIFGFMTFGKGIDAYSREDSRRSYGIFYFGLSTFIVALITYLVYELVGEELGMQLYYAAGIAYFCLSLGDGLAPIAVRLFKFKNPELLENRTLLGTVTVFLVSFISTAVFSWIFDLNLPALFILSVAALVAIVEFYGIKGIDNILIDLGVFVYLVLYYLGQVTLIFEIVVILSPILACLAFLSKTLTFSGGVVTLVMFYLIGYFSDGGFLPIIFMCGMFMLASASSVISKKVKKTSGEKEKSSHARSGIQVLAVGFAAVIALMIHHFTKEPLFYLLYYVCLAEQFADSISSDIGCLTKGKNMDILRWKPVPKGISGGVSLLGTLLALVSSFAVLVLCVMPDVKIGFVACVLAAVIAFLGTILDSILGSLLQARYSCSVCGVMTESDVHCGVKAKLVKGSKCVNNVTVNLLSSVGTFLLGLLLFTVI